MPHHDSFPISACLSVSHSLTRAHTYKHRAHLLSLSLSPPLSLSRAPLLSLPLHPPHAPPTLCGDTHLLVKSMKVAKAAARFVPRKQPRACTSLPGSIRLSVTAPRSCKSSQPLSAAPPLPACGEDAAAPAPASAGGAGAAAAACREGVLAAAAAYGAPAVAAPLCVSVAACRGFGGGAVERGGKGGRGRHGRACEFRTR